MLVIRLRRIGRTHDPHYRVVVTEHTAPPQGKFIAEIGHHHPKSKETVINQNLLTEWLTKGAKPSNTVAKLCQKAGMTHKHIVVKQYHGKPKLKPEATKPSAQPAAQAPEAEPAEATEADAAPETPEPEAAETPAEASIDSPAQKTTPESSQAEDDKA